MPHFTLQVVQEGPVISLLVGASAPRVTALQEAGLDVPQAVVLRCLIDTGASGTCVDGAAIAPLGLTPTGSTLISTPSTGGTPHQCATYDVGMMFVHPAGNRFFGTVAVVATDFSAQPIDGLLGRDVLSSCLLVYDGAAKIFSIAF
jgi:hypothetical protein